MSQQGSSDKGLIAIVVAVIGATGVIIAAYISRPQPLPPSPPPATSSIISGFITTTAPSPTSQPIATFAPSPTNSSAPIPSSTPHQIITTPDTTTNLNQDIIPGTTKDTPIALLRHRPQTYHKGPPEDAIINIIDQGNSFAYQFTYNLPTDEAYQEYYAGFQFKSDAPEDLSNYGYINITITFGDNQTKCKFYLRNEDDYQHKPQYVPLDSPPEDVIVEGAGPTRTIRIPLHFFNEINLTDVKQIGFDTNTLYTRGQHSFIIESISFSKK